MPSPVPPAALVHVARLAVHYLALPIRLAFRPVAFVGVACGVGHDAVPGFDAVRPVADVGVAICTDEGPRSVRNASGVLAGEIAGSEV